MNQEQVSNTVQTTVNNSLQPSGTVAPNSRASAVTTTTNTLTNDSFLEKNSYTLDYNKLYNITPKVVPTSNKPSNINIPDNVQHLDNSLDDLQMAAPPSFDITANKKETQEEVKQPVIPEISKEELVSVDIVEPTELPVGSITREEEKKSDINHVNVIQNQSLPINQNINKVQNNQSIINQVPLNNTVPVNNPYVNGAINQQSMRPSNQVVGQRFISNDENKYSFAKEEVVDVNSPTSPELLADPMSIFGVAHGALRPTAGESLNEVDKLAVQPQPTQGTVVLTCPNCGFIVKEGQPSCLVCGCKFNL